MNKVWYLMYNIMAIVNNIVFCDCNSLRIEFKLYKHKNKYVK